MGDGASTAGGELVFDVSPHWGLNENLAFTRDRDLGSPAGTSRVYIQSQLTATIPYAGGTLDSIDTGQVNFLFGTDGNIVPEPSTTALLALGLAALGSRRRRRLG